jgi:outer membrane protein OmpA-like peptidoglycan-associated protein
MKSTMRGVLAVSLFLCAGAAPAQQLFRDLVGNVPVGEVKQKDPLRVPYITWGGDVATFWANGGLKTKPGSLFQQQGLNLELTAGDDFVQQVRDYLAGKTPLLRGTLHMMGMASEVIGSDPRTKGVVLLQMTWSAGDHCVARERIRTVADLKGATVVLQQGGPHVGLLDDILKTAQLSWNDIKVIWAKDLTGTAESPAEIFRKNPAVDACFVISPDMIGLTGGMQNTGSGAEGTVKGARVLVSTAELSRSIADVYVCRKDFYDANRDLVTRFVAGYLRACEEIVDLKKQYEAKGSEKYMEILRLAQSIYGKEVLPTLEEDAHGLISDCTFVGHPGNVAFFGQKNRFEAMQAAALDLAVGRGYAKVRSALLPTTLDWNSPALLNLLKKTGAVQGERFRAEAVLEEIEELSAGKTLDDRTIYSFTINFQPNQTEFSAEQYGVEFQRVVDLADKYGNAVIAVRGHADPSKTLIEFVKAGMEKGVLQRTGSQGDYRYSFQGRPLDLASTEALARNIEGGAFDGVPGHSPRETMQAALNLSRTRAEQVRAAIVKYAKDKGLTLDASQIQPVGVGIREPFIAKPRNMAEAEQNMRVEFRLLRVTAEATKDTDFDF